MPLRKLRKALKGISKAPSVEEVHQLRTRAARVKAVLKALQPRGARELLRSIEPVRNAAGAVRDTDVLLLKVLALPPTLDEERRVRLVEELGQMRTRDARKLHQGVQRRGEAMRKLLRRCEARLAEASSTQENEEGAEGSAEAAATASRLAAELGAWQLRETNVHKFRIKVKQLRYTLELAGDAPEELLAMLEKTKDRIGEWHDSQVLLEIAAGVLQDAEDSALLRHLRMVERRSLKEAMEIARRCQATCFRGAEPAREPTSRAGGRKPAAIRKPAQRSFAAESAVPARIA